MVKKLVSKRYLRYLLIVPSLVLIFILCSCADLGSLDDADTFYSSFGEIVGKYDDGENNLKNASYKLEGLMNDSTMKDYTWADDDDEVEFHQYLYIVIPIKKDLKIKSFGLCTCGIEEELATQEILLEANVFYIPNDSSLPDDDKIKLLSATNLEEASDPDISTRIASATYNITSDWNGNNQTWLYFQSFSNSEYVSNEKLNAQNGSYIYIRFENNSAFNKGTKTPCTFSFMNLLISAD